MREIDPLREPSEALLSAALHRLAKGSSNGAPDELGASLACSFRQHHARRRRARVAGWSALAACLLAAVVLLIRFTAAPAIPVSPNIAEQPQPMQTPTVANQTERPVAKHRREQNGRNRLSATAQDNREDDGFVPLPSYDPAINTGDLQVVRLELSGADLRLVGAPVAEDLSDRLLLADVVVGRDGTPYAVRFVQ
jgi:hypothetical protein